MPLFVIVVVVLLCWFFDNIICKTGWKLLAICFVISRCADALSTYVAIDPTHLEYESNSITRYLMAHLGIGFGLIVKQAFTIPITLLCGIALKYVDPMLQKRFLAFVAIVGFIAALNNMLFKLLTLPLPQ